MQTYSTKEYYDFLLLKQEKRRIENHLKALGASKDPRRMSLYQSIMELYSNKGSFKTVNFEKYLEYLLHVYSNNVHAAISYNLTNQSREWRFRKFRRKQKFFNRIFRHLRDGVVGIGNWGWGQNSAIRKVRGPIKEIKRFLKSNGVTVIELDEFRTSKMCCQCEGGELIPVTYTTPRPKQKVKISRARNR